MSLRKMAGLFAGFALAVGLIGAGVSASFSDAVTAKENINVGTFQCKIIAATPLAASDGIALDGKSVTYTAPTIMSSAAGSAPFSFTVENTGSIAARLTVSTSPVSAPWSIINAPLPAATLAAGGTQVYSTGVNWTELNNSNLGQVGTVTWTVNCNEVPAPVTVDSNVLHYGPTGWGGWSCPIGDTIVSATVTGGTYASLTLWKPGASVPGSTYPATPFGYTYATGEEGAIVQNDNVGKDLYIHLVCQP
jgi:predicted ribosomally synthesized peptide with SipW-like signal peptide